MTLFLFPPIPRRGRIIPHTPGDKMNRDLKTPDYVIQLARDMRNNMTDAEKMLWSRLRKKQVCGLKFRSQHPVHRYILDFYCNEKLLAIELNGEIHKKKYEYDDFRDDFMCSLGIKTLRFSNQEVLYDIDAVIKKIKNEVL